MDILWLCYKTKYTTPDKVSENLAVYEESYQKFFNMGPLDPDVIFAWRNFLKIVNFEI